jgi:ribosome-binding factor A
MSRRLDRVNHLLQQEIAELLTRELKDPRLGVMVSITGVETSPDLRTAKVFVSIYGSETESEQALEALRGAAGFLRRELSARLRMKQVPALVFERDRSIERGARIAQLLREVAAEREARAKAEPAES